MKIIIIKRQIWSAISSTKGIQNLKGNFTQPKENKMRQLQNYVLRKLKKVLKNAPLQE